MGWVIDASSAVDLLDRGPLGAATRRVVAHGDLHAPDLITMEVASALARRSRAGFGGVDQAIHEFVEMPLTRHKSHRLMAKAWQRRGNIRVADAFYVELARELRLPLLTSDVRLGKAIEQHRLCGVHVVTV